MNEGECLSTSKECAFPPSPGGYTKENAFPHQRSMPFHLATREECGGYDTKESTFPPFPHPHHDKRVNFHPQLVIRTHVQINYASRIIPRPCHSDHLDHTQSS
ncbi:uncharacterized protein DS421_13g437260 [Arachis hypogaea]|nr:uncharacterized protein DS421_13g437260 [Arachis hypogaea]